MKLYRRAHRGLGIPKIFDRDVFDKAVVVTGAGAEARAVQVEKDLAALTLKHADVSKRLVATHILAQKAADRKP